MATDHVLSYTEGLLEMQISVKQKARRRMHRGWTRLTRNRAGSHSPGHVLLNGKRPVWGKSGQSNPLRDARLWHTREVCTIACEWHQVLAAHRGLSAACAACLREGYAQLTSRCAKQEVFCSLKCLPSVTTAFSHSSETGLNCEIL